MNVTGASARSVKLDTFIGDIEGASWQGSEADLTSFVMAEQIKTADEDICAKMSEVRLAADARKLINTRIQQLREMLNVHKAKYKDDLKRGLTEEEWGNLLGENVPFVGTKLDIELNAQAGTARAVEGATYGTGSKTIQERVVTDPVAKQTQDWQAEFVLARQRSSLPSETVEKPTISGDDLDIEIKRLQDYSQELDSGREISMIQLNSSISKRGNYVQWLSNLVKKANDTSSGIVNNLR